MSFQNSCSGTSTAEAFCSKLQIAEHKLHCGYRLLDMEHSVADAFHEILLRFSEQFRGAFMAIYDGVFLRK